MLSFGSLKLAVNTFAMTSSEIGSAGALDSSCEVLGLLPSDDPCGLDMLGHCLSAESRDYSFASEFEGNRVLCRSLTLGRMGHFQRREYSIL